MTDAYHINIFYSAEDGGYIADIPDLTSCSAFGCHGSRCSAGSGNCEGCLAGCGQEKPIRRRDISWLYRSRLASR